MKLWGTPASEEDLSCHSYLWLYRDFRVVYHTHTTAGRASEHCHSALSHAFLEHVVAQGDCCSASAYIIAFSNKGEMASRLWLA